MTMIERLFLRFSARYQRTWTSLFPSAEAFDIALQEWAVILADVNAVGIERALHRCLKEFPTYPPKPAEFLALTRPSADELGILPVDTAFRAAIEQRWHQHPIVWHVVTAIGQYEFRRMPHRQAWHRFGDVYEQFLNLLIEKRRNDPGFELQIPNQHYPSLSHDKPTTITATGDAHAHIAAIRRRLSRPPQNPRG